MKMNKINELIYLLKLIVVFLHNKKIFLAKIKIMIINHYSLSNDNSINGDNIISQNSFQKNQLLDQSSAVSQSINNASLFISNIN